MTPFNLFRDYATIIDYQTVARGCKGKTRKIAKDRFTKAHKIFSDAVKGCQAITRLSNLIIYKLREDAFSVPYF